MKQTQNVILGSVVFLAIFGCGKAKEKEISSTPDISISAVSPSTGSTSGTNTLTLTGANFLSGVSVTVGGADCSNISLISATQISCTAPSGPVGLASIVVTNTVAAQPTGTRTATLATAYTYVIPTVFDLYFGSQTGTTSLLLKLRFNSDTNAISLTTTSNVTSNLLTDGIRSLIDLASGGFLLGGYNSGASVWSATLDPLNLGPTLTLSGRPAAELTDILGGCTLPNGNIIAGSYGNKLNAEYSSSRSYLRDLPAMTYYLADCVAAGSGNTLYVSDYDANSDTASEVRKLTYNGSAWSIASSLTVTTFGGSTNGSAYSLVLNSNGHLYIPPQNPVAGGVRKVIRCLNADLTTCAAIGPNWPVDYPGGAIEGAVQIPGTNDMLFIDNTSIYRYNVATDTLTPIYTLAVAGHQWTRNMRIREIPN